MAAAGLKLRVQVEDGATRRSPPQAGPSLRAGFNHEWARIDTNEEAVHLSELPGLLFKSLVRNALPNRSAGEQPRMHRKRGGVFLIRAIREIRG